MKKLLTFLMLTSSVALLHADYYGNGSCGSQSNQGYQQGYYQGGGGSYYQGNPNAQSYSDNARQNQQNQGQPAQNQGYGYQGYNGGVMGGYQGNQGQGYGYQGQAQGNPGQNNDQTLTSDIQDSLHSAFSNKYNNVRVQVNNGYVTLQGTVPSQDDKTNLEQKVRNMDGVRGVNNQVTVQNGNQNKYKY